LHTWKVHYPKTSRISGKQVSLTLSLNDLEGHRCGGWLGLVGAEAHPLLLQPLLVVQVVLHVVEDHVASGDVHGGDPRLLLPVPAQETGRKW